TCNDHIYLHSTMLLLYRDVVVLSDEIIKEFTFHYASTLSFPGIYFQNPPHYLHSTMLLLYRISFRLPTSSTLIYIPLCFYFISRSLPWPPPTSGIYIPLCFYFIPVMTL